MDNSDPLSQFFRGEEDVDLYAVLSLRTDASVDSIKKAYRKFALIYHPDKHVTSSAKEQQDASTKFQQVGFAYAVLGDSKRKFRYDSTGRTDEGFELSTDAEGWEAYFEELFDRVTCGKLDEMKREYQGSVEEIDDIKEAYNTTDGNLGVIITHVPHSTHEDESRIITIITDLIKTKELKSTPTWLSTSKDEKAKIVRKKAASKEAKEAEELAKELGLWDEFYTSGRPTERNMGKGKGKEKAGEAELEEDYSALQALILKKEKNLDDFFDNLAAKYTEPAAKGKKRGHDPEADTVSPRKKSRSKVPPPPELDDEEFAKIQKKIFGEKSSPRRKKEKARKAK